MRAYIGNTDYGWYSFLVKQPNLDEVNFWKPLGGATFKALDVGQPFFFKLKKAHGNAVVGFGLFALFRKVSLLDAWEVLGKTNGAADFNEMRNRVARYMRKAKALELTRHHEIGCILLTNPVFFPKDFWVDGPTDWHPNIVAGKNYETTVGEGKRIWNECLERLERLRTGKSANYNPNVVREGHRFGPERTIRPRLGQGTFRYTVERAYQKCAVTREHSLPALEAAHIIPYSAGGLHEITNGLLLRADIHRLFDRGYVTVTPDFEFKVSDSLGDDYHNGKVYYQLNGHHIWLPKNKAEWPKRENLEYHAKLFRG